MKKNNIRSKFVKDTLTDSIKLAQSLKENAQETVRALLQDTVKNEFKSIMNEALDKDENEDEKDYEVTEVEDTNDTEADEIEDTEEESTEEETEDDVDTEESSTEEETDVEDTDDGWSEFDEYKVSDNEYDLTKDGGDNFAKIYKKLSDEDQVVIVKKSDNEFELKDNQEGTEYLIKLGEEDNTEENFDEDLDADFGEENNLDDMNESQIFEVALNEYNSNTQYTDNYQSKDAMTTDGMTEPGKNVNDWDKGVPKGTEKPWAKPKKKTTPFDKDGAKQVTESEEVETEEDETLEEANLSQSRWNDTHAAHNRVPAANKDEYRRKGMQKTSKGATYRANGGSNEDVNEAIKKIATKTKAIYKENQELKAQMGKLRLFLEQAAVTTKNLGYFVRLVTENSTTAAEKKQIIARFNQEANSVEKSDALYESISNELKNKNVISESKLTEKQYSTKPMSKINEVKMVESKDLNKSLDLMNRICRF